MTADQDLYRRVRGTTRIVWDDGYAVAIDAVYEAVQSLPLSASRQEVLATIDSFRDVESDR